MTSFVMWCSVANIWRTSAWICANVSAKLEWRPYRWLWRVAWKIWVLLAATWLIAVKTEKNVWVAYVEKYWLAAVVCSSEVSGFELQTAQQARRQLVQAGVGRRCASGLRGLSQANFLRSVSLRCSYARLSTASSPATPWRHVLHEATDIPRHWALTKTNDINDHKAAIYSRLFMHFQL